MSDILKGRMPVYVCHKEVRGAKITGIRYCHRGTNSLLILGEINSEIEVDSKWYARCQPKVGGYFILYEDGYMSYSPERAFEEGYALKAKKAEPKNPPKRR